jgi:tRNA(fMet)-specific endonuclease VapC
MTLYLLDTNTCIHAMRGTAAVIAAMATKATDDIAISSITCYELYVGVEKCANPRRERGKVDTLIDTLPQMTFDSAAARRAARIRADLEARGEMIGPYDVLIAWRAEALGLTLVTANAGEFCRVAGLAVEDWS